MLNFSLMNPPLHDATVSISTRGTGSSFLGLTRHICNSTQNIGLEHQSTKLIRCGNKAKACPKDLCRKTHIHGENNKGIYLFIKKSGELQWKHRQLPPVSHDYHTQLVSEVLHFMNLYKSSHLVDLIQILHHIRLVAVEEKNGSSYSEP